MTRPMDGSGGKTVSDRTRLFTIGLGVSALVATADLASKWVMAEVVLDPPRVIPIAPFFNLVLGFNRGISFGLLADLGPGGPVALSVLALGIIGLLVVWLWRATHFGEALGISMIIGGAMGNLIDRAADGAVTDFLDFYVGRYHWPAFNLADTAIVLGVALVLLDSFKTPKKPGSQKS